MLRISRTYLLILLLVCISFQQNFAQDDFSFIKEKEAELKILYDSLFASNGTKYYKTDAEKLEYNKQIIDIFDEILDDENSFNYTFDSLNHIGVRYSPDSLVKVFTWNLKFSDGSFMYYGYLQHLHNKKGEVNTFKLIDKSEEIEDPLNASLQDTNWFGCLYTTILFNKNGNKKYYTLFGWDGNNLLTNKKIIEVLTFNKDGSPVFGKSMFNVENVKSKRLIFEFSNSAVMAITYDENLKMIIYDYLSPSKPIQKGLPQYYGPDATYDGLLFNKGKWEHYSNIDLKTLKNSGYRPGIISNGLRKGTYTPVRKY